MQISADNIGQVICLDHRSQLIQIEDVSDKQVTYRSEVGHRYGTEQRVLAGSVVQDRARIQEFERNFALGHSLIAAEQSALHKYLCAQQHDHDTRNEAKRALETIRTQQAHLERRVEERNLLASREDARTQSHSSHEQKRDRLDDMILSAQSRSAAEHSHRGAPTKEQTEQEEISL